MIRTLALCGLLAGLTACTTPPATPAAGAAGMCNGQNIGPLQGNRMTPDLEQRAKALSGASVVRVISPGEAITRDYNDGRLNLQLDSYGVVVRAYCG